MNPTQSATSQPLAPIRFNSGKSIGLFVVFRFQRPSCHYVSRNRTNGNIKPVFLGSTPVGDVDNYAKFTMDALNQVLYRDDAQVVNIEGQKMYAENPNSVGSTTIT